MYDMNVVKVLYQQSINLLFNVPGLVVVEHICDISVAIYSSFLINVPIFTRGLSFRTLSACLGVIQQDSGALTMTSRKGQRPSLV